MDSQKRIEFYLQNGPYGGFSNFSRHPVFLNGKYWPTSEHYFQAQKFVGTEREERIRLVNKPMTAAKMGRNRRFPLRIDWLEVRDEVMSEVVMAKFTQHASLKALLLGTGNAVLIEHTANDNYWADGGDGTGRNRLGEILEDVRSLLQKGKTEYGNGSFA